MTSRPDSHTPSEQVRKARKRRWWVVLVVLVAAALAAAALGPTLLSTPPGAASLLGYVGSLIGGRMTADDLSLSWFGRQEVSGLDARTDEGAPVAAVRYCSLDAGLLNLLWTGRIGAVTVRDADVYVEGLCQLKPPESAKPPPRKADEAAEAPTLPLSVEIRGLKLHAKEATVHLEQATFNTAPAGDTLEASLKVARGADEGRGSVTARIEGLSSDFRGWDAIGVRGAVKAESLPLAALFDILAAAGVPAQGGGTLAGSADAARERSGAVNVQTQWVGQDVWLSGDILRGDKLAMGRVDLSARLSLRGDTVEVDSLRLESPVVAAQAQGTFVLPTGEGAKAGAAKASGTGRLAADLAALARMLPATLGLHKDLQIESGRLEATVAASHEAAAAADVLRIAADIKDFGGRRVGRPVALQPVHLDAEISDDAQGLAVRNLLATGSFGRVEGSGRTSALTLTVSIALDKAVADVGQFIDLGGRSASGNLKATLKTRGPPAGRQGGGPAGPVSLDLAAEATDLALVLAPYSRWHERRATLAAQAEIAMDAQGAPVQATVSSLRLSGAAGEAAGQGTLRFQPAGWTADGAITGQGEVAALAAQVAGLTGGKPTDASGQWSLQAQARGGLDTGLDMKLRADVRNLAYAPPAAGEPTPAGAPAKSSGAAGATDVPAPPAGVAGPAGPAGPVAAGAAPGPGAASAAGASASAGPARAPVAVGDLSAAADVRVASRQSGLDVSVHQLDITGPGLTGRVAGEVSVPASQPAGKSSSVLTIAGQGDLRVELAQASGVLRAMGLVAPGSRLAGAVTAQARAEQKAGGLAGAVKVEGRGVDVFLAESGAAVREAQAVLPLDFSRDGATGRWTVAAEGISSSLVRGRAKAAITPAEKHTAVDAEADLAVDGPSLRALLGSSLPAEFTLAGAWPVTAKVAGQVPTGDVEWNRRVASLAGEGRVGIGSFEFRGLRGTEGEIVWRLEGGKILPQQDGASIVRAAVNSGQVAVGGLVDLAGQPPRFRLPQRSEVVRGVQMTEDMAGKMLAYVSPLLGHTVAPVGLLSVTLAEADLPLDSKVLERGTVRGELLVDNYQTRFKGPLALLTGWAGLAGEAPTQRFGPTPIHLENGLFHIKDQEVSLAGRGSIKAEGTIAVADGAMQTRLGVPLTDSLLGRAGARAPVQEMLAGHVVWVPLRGTVKEPRLDEKAMLQEVLKALPGLLLKPGGILDGIFGKPEKEKAPPPGGKPEAESEKKRVMPEDLLDIFLKPRPGPGKDKP